MKLAANLSWLYTDLAFSDRLHACAEDGFRHAECMFPYGYSATALAGTASNAAVQWVLINAPAGDWAQGDRGLAIEPTRRDEFRRSIELACQYASTMGVQKVHVLAGVVNLSDSYAVGRAWNCYEENLAWLADSTQDQAIDWLIEPINRHDMPGYLLSEQFAAHALIQRLARPNLGIQMDLYHCQRVEGNALAALRQYLPSGRVKHLQIAGVPDRNEPACAGLDYSQVYKQLCALNYTGHIGCEYRPTGATRDGLKWIRQTGFSGTMESFKS